MRKQQLLNDQQLVSRYIKGDESALAELVERHKTKVFSYILKLVKEKELAEDIFQDTFFKVINSLKKGKYLENGKFVSWVICIAHNMVMDHFRVSKQMKTVSEVKNNDGVLVDIFSTLNIDDKSVDHRIIKSQNKDKIRKLIWNLPANQREVVLMRHYYDMSFLEIAERIEVSTNTALGRMRYALINIRKMIEEQGIDINN